MQEVFREMRFFLRENEFFPKDKSYEIYQWNNKNRFLINLTKTKKCEDIPLPSLRKD